MKRTDIYEALVPVLVLCSGLHVLSDPHSPLPITLWGREYHQSIDQMVKLRPGEGAGLAKEFPDCEEQEAWPSVVSHKVTLGSPFPSTPKCVPIMKLRSVLRRKNPPGPQALS